MSLIEFLIAAIIMFGGGIGPYDMVPQDDQIFIYIDGRLESAICTKQDCRRG